MCFGCRRNCKQILFRPHYTKQGDEQTESAILNAIHTAWISWPPAPSRRLNQLEVKTNRAGLSWSISFKPHLIFHEVPHDDLIKFRRGQARTHRGHVAATSSRSLSVKIGSNRMVTYKRKRESPGQKTPLPWSCRFQWIANDEVRWSRDIPNSYKEEHAYRTHDPVHSWRTLTRDNDWSCIRIRLCDSADLGAMQKPSLTAKPAKWFHNARMNCWYRIKQSRLWQGDVCICRLQDIKLIETHETLRHLPNTVQIMSC